MRFAIVGLVLVAATLPQRALAATCTVTAARVTVPDGDFERPLPEMVGFGIPVTVTESSGTFHMDFSGVPDGTFSISGVANSLIVTQAGGIDGKIDGNGNVSLPKMPVNFTTALVDYVLNATESLTTGIGTVSLSGTDYAAVGSPLDFSSGALRLEAQGLVTNAPVVGVSTTGFSLACTLAPIPSAAALPAGPTVTAHGTAKPGKAGDAATVVGDDLVVKAKIKDAGTFDPAQDLFVRVALGGADVALVRVPGGTLTSKGKKLSASDTDGTKLHLVVGRKQTGNVRADLKGSIVLAQGKKSSTLTLKQSGADLSALSSATAGAAATVTIGFGPIAASDAVSVKPGAKRTVLK